MTGIKPNSNVLCSSLHEKAACTLDFKVQAAFCCGFRLVQPTRVIQRHAFQLNLAAASSFMKSLL